MVISSGRTMDSWTFEFLYTILQWKTDWFDNPKNHLTSEKSLREILGDNCPLDLNSTLLCYKTTKDYYATMKPLMVHELFHSLLKDTDDHNKDDDDDDDGDGDDNNNNIKSNSRPQTIGGYIINKHVTCEGRFSTKKLLIIKIKMFYHISPAPRKPPDDIPRRGDLVHIICNRGKKKVFGYIYQMDWKQKKYTLATRVNTGYLNKDLKLETVTSIQQNVHQVWALRDLPKSSLFNAIMKPNEIDYTFSEDKITTLLSLKLKQKKLNYTQLKIVAGIVETADNPDPKICCIQGPPGTGKTTAIIAMITELFSKKSRRIIVCAPSNKAADGVLLKLLKIQTGFNLNIVRVGREEKMDPKVKEVSLEYLASKIEGRERKERILANADVIVSTLTSCFTSKMENVFGYSKINIPICIVDEAGQSTELATLIPLMLGIKTLILVGDPQQLPPTIISPLAKRKGMDLSLFSRAQKCFENRPKNPIQMLNVQYRMNDQIAAWPNDNFYDGKISSRAQNDPLPLCHYKILNHNSHQQTLKISNKSESRLIINLLSVIINDIPELKQKKNKPSISVITPYRDQKKIITDMLISRCSLIKQSRDIQYNILNKYDDLDKEKLVENIKNNHPPVKNNNIKKGKNISTSKSNDNDKNSKTKNKKSLKKKEKKNDEKEKNNQTGGILIVETPEQIAKRIMNKLNRSKNKINSRGKFLPLCEKKINLAIEDSLDKLSLNPTKKTEEKLFTAKEIRKIDIILKKIDELSKLYNQWQSVEVNTVDSFQGREQDIIIMSCVRSRGIGFVSDPNRLNVSLTRAKHTMILCGNFETFRKNTMWRDLLADAENRGVYANINHDIKPAKLKDLIFVEEKK